MSNPHELARAMAATELSLEAGALHPTHPQAVMYRALQQQRNLVVASSVVAHLRTICRADQPEWPREQILKMLEAVRP